jgi:hypothetical protein
VPKTFPDGGQADIAVDERSGVESAARGTCGSTTGGIRTDHVGAAEDCSGNAPFKRHR